MLKKGEKTTFFSETIFWAVFSHTKYGRHTCVRGGRVTGHKPFRPHPLSASPTKPEYVCFPEPSTSINLSVTLIFISLSLSPTLLSRLSQSFPYKAIVRLFDQKDGMRKLINVISTLSIHSLENETDESEDALHQVSLLSVWFEIVRFKIVPSLCIFGIPFPVCKK